MKRLVLFIGLLWITHAWAQFLPQTEDIPLMQGITISESSVFSFDSPSGQILTIEGKTDIPPSKIRGFYSETLSEMGWRSVRPNTYTRGTDTLTISFPATGKIHFDITLSNNMKD